MKKRMMPGSAALLALCLCAQLHFSLQQSCPISSSECLNAGAQCVQSCSDPSMGSEWFSNVRCSSIEAREIVIAWERDTESTEYLVQFRSASGGTFNISERISELSYRITGLIPETCYEVEICRVNGTGTCGQCLKCFTTPFAEEPPSAPQDFTLTAEGSQVVIISWQAPRTTNGGILSYNLQCVNTNSGTLVHNNTGIPSSTTRDTVSNLSPNTSYTCTLAAVNQHGAGMSAVAEIITPARRDSPGILLLVFASSIDYVQVVPEVIRTAPASILSMDNVMTLMNTPSFTVTGIDYHYPRSELYLATSEEEIRRVSLNVTEMDGAMELVVDSEVTLFSRGPGVTLGSVAVDWVYNEIYWIEYTQSGGSKILRAPLDGTVVYCVVEWTSEPALHLAVDPVHGYFYWIRNGTATGLYRTILSTVRQSSTDCPTQISGDPPLITGVTFETFVLELVPEFQMLYYIGPCQSDVTLDTGIAAVPLSNIQGDSIVDCIAPVPPPQPNMDSFDEVIFIPTIGTMDIFLINSSESFPDHLITQAAAAADINLIRMYRDAKQPLPVPPSSPTGIEVQTTPTTATISWIPPEFIFIGDLFSESAFQEWVYEVNYAEAGSSQLLSVSTTSTNITVEDLQPGTVYEFTISAGGPGGERRAPDEFVFSTKMEGSESVRLLIASEVGLIEAGVDGSNPQYIDLQNSRECNSIAYDSHLGVAYWVIVSGQSNVYAYNSSSATTVSLSDVRADNPFGMQLDWVSRRLFWVEDGESTTSPLRIVTLSTESGEKTDDSFVSGAISATAMDSLNGLLFWSESSDIFLNTLNGLRQEQCHSAPASPTALAVDVVNQQLYYLSPNGQEGFTVSQLAYSRDGCSDSVEARTLPDLSFGFATATPTVLAYASSTLFIGSRSHNVLYTLPANLTATTIDQTLAFGTIDFSLSLDPQPQSFRDASFIAQSVQPLPADLVTRGVAAVTPGPPSSPPQLGGGSSESVIVIEWGGADPPLPFSSPVLYTVTYSLMRLDGSMGQGQEDELMSTSLTLTNQSPFSYVSATVQAYSYWAVQSTTMQDSFTSPPGRPGQVQNVRVFGFSPDRDGLQFTVLVVWDGLSLIEAMGEVQSYTVEVFENGVALSGLTQNDDNSAQNDDNSTQLVIERRNSRHRLSYPLERGTTYNVTVFASNSVNDGDPSEPVTFSSDTLTTLQQVFTVSAAGGEVVGEGGGRTVEVRAPLTVNTIGREVYWYSSEMNAVMVQSLDEEEVQTVLVEDAPVVVAISYDWVGERVYFISRESPSGTLSLWRVPIINPAGLERVFPAEGEESFPLEDNTVARLAVDPYGGFVYWLLSSSTTILQRIDLRSNSLTDLTTGSTRRRRQTIDTFELSPALTQDPVNGRLWVCDNVTGDILSCNSSDENCTVEVEAAALMASETGLPATSLALDELRIYWTQEGSSNVFFVPRDNTTLLSLLSSSAPISELATLSLGQQPLPATLPIPGDPTITCLTPDVTFVLDRPVPRLVEATNTTLLIEWDPLELPEVCEDVVFSFATITYFVNARVTDGDPPLPGFPMSTFETQFLVTGLLSHFEYMISVGGANQYSEHTGPLVLGALGSDEPISTAPGIPDPPQNLQSLVFGTQDIHLNWSEPILLENDPSNTLRGPEENLTYYVIVSQIGFEESTTTNSFNLTGLVGLEGSTEYTIEVVVSNLVRNSSASVEIVTTWFLPPAPVVVGFTNTTITAMVVLNQSHEDIVEIFLMVTDGINFNFETPPQLVESLPTNLNFTIGSESNPLDPGTSYTLVAVATYREVEGFTTMAEVQSGVGTTQPTAPGRPEAPVASLDGEILTWTERDDNGAPIDEYRVATEPNSTRDVFVSSQEPRMVNLRTENFLEFNVAYNIQVYAINSVGEGEASNIIEFTLLPESEESSGLAFGAVIGIAAGGTVFIILLGIIIFLVVCFCCLTPGQKRQELRLSYMYGPDHELSNLRDAYRQTQAANPHYMWSRDDYVCTDEDLEQLNKFPRHHLKLETFIDRGEFGEVYQGTAIDILGAGTGPTPVAVKTLRKGTTLDEQRKFLSEAALMGNFNHPNIVKVLGVCVDNDPVYIIMELMPAGDLLKFLREAKREHGPALLTLTEQIQVALDVAQGCRYLEQQHFIHRDIAARNCLVSSRGADRVVKIGDFGLAKDLYSSDYYQVEGQRKLPVRWMGPEALLQGKFTSESDIWSYGVLLWEIMTLGNQPYPGMTNQEVLQFVTGGGRLSRAERCPGRIYHLMQLCWKKYGSERPHFQQICTTLANFLEHLRNRESVYYDSDSGDEGGDTMTRKGSSRGVSRTPSLRSGIINLARSGSLKIRNSLRRHGSIHRSQDHGAHNHQFSVSSSENLIASEEGGSAFRERGPF